MQKLKNMTLSELLKLRDEIDNRIQALAQAELAELEQRMDDVRRLVRSESELKGRKVKAKYRDPKSGKTWSGRGQTPVWLRTYEELGKNRAEFLIQAA